MAWTFVVWVIENRSGARRLLASQCNRTFGRSHRDPSLVIEHRQTRAHVWLGEFAAVECADQTVQQGRADCQVPQQLR